MKRITVLSLILGLLATVAIAQVVDTFGGKIEATLGGQNASGVYRLVAASNGGVNWASGEGLISFAKDTGIAYGYNSSAVNWTVPVTDSGRFIVNTASTADVRNTLPPAAVGLTYTFIANTAQQIAVIPASGADTIDYASLAAGAGIQNSSAAKGDSITLVCVVAKHWSVAAMHGTWASGS